MFAQLPYPGFSWSLTRHMGRVDQRTVYELLQVAYVYSGDINFRRIVAEYLVEHNLLTANYREDTGKNDPWRDYQQILPELGLIVSKRNRTNNIDITPIGLMFLDGLIGYSELMTTQALKYQYPNGMKLTIPKDLRDQLESAGLQVPSSRTQLDARHHILIKPAVLILRILLELYESGISNPILTSGACANALVPTKTNQDWPYALARLQMKQTHSQVVIDKRDVQEWFSFLSYTDLFILIDGSRDSITLSPMAINNLNSVRDLCEFHEQAENYWIPQSENRATLSASWFDYYGRANITEQWSSPDTSDEYIEANYQEGIDENDEITQRDAVINLSPYSPRLPSFNSIPKVEVERIAQGHERRQQQSKLHETIVDTVAQKLHREGFELLVDPNSVDLLASKDNVETIVEVKTVNQRNFYTRLRLGVGQLSEYRFRRQEQTNERPAGILVLSSGTQLPEWLLRYFVNDIQLGLVTFSSKQSFTPLTDGLIEHILAQQ